MFPATPILNLISWDRLTAYILFMEIMETVFLKIGMPIR